MTKTQDILTLAKNEKALHQRSMYLENKASDLEDTLRRCNGRVLPIWMQLREAKPKTALEMFIKLHIVLVTFGGIEEWYTSKEQTDCLTDLATFLGLTKEQAQEVRDLFMYGPDEAPTRIN